MSLCGEAGPGLARHGMERPGAARQGNHLKGGTKLSVYTIKIVGTTPLMQNNPQSMLFAPKGKTRAQTNLPPHEQAERGVYRDGELFVHPATAFRNAFVTAAKQFKIGRTSAATRLSGCMSLDPAEYVVICDGNGEPVKDYEVDVRTVVMPSTKGRVVRGRPKFNEWGCTLTLTMNDKFWPGDDDLLREILDYAGEMVGVGDGRPEKKLTFGKFKAELA